MVFMSSDNLTDFGKKVATVFEDFDRAIAKFE